jgi:hypothetical protein
VAVILSGAMDERSYACDRPLLHALVNPGVASGFGIEIDRIKCDKAAAFLKHSLAELGRRGGGTGLALPRVQCSSIEKASASLPGLTFPLSLMLPSSRIGFYSTPLKPQEMEYCRTPV